MAGKEGTEAVLGTPFLSLLESTATLGSSSSIVSLTECMVASSMGNDMKLFLLPRADPTPSSTEAASSFLHEQQQQQQSRPLECHIRVSPIVARKTESREVTSVTHFAIEMYSTNESGSINNDKKNNNIDRINMSSIHASPTENCSANLSVGVMG
jgi:hypothetical protein